MHKDYMKWLKENDPITYYEMTSNPTGSDSDETVFGCVLTVIGFLILFIVLFLWKLL